MAAFDPTYKVEIAFVSNPLGVLTWTDVSAYVRMPISVTRGRAYELTATEAGTMSLLLDNSDGRFDPTNGTSPYAPYVLPMRPIRLTATHTATAYPVFRGFVLAWPQTWDLDGVQPMVRIIAVDGFKTALAKKYGTRYPDQVVADAPFVYLRLNGTTTNLGSSGSGATITDFVNGGGAGLIAGTSDTAAVRTAATTTAAVQVVSNTASTKWSVEFWINSTTTSATATTLVQLGNVTMPYSAGVYGITIAGTVTGATFTAGATHHIVIAADTTTSTSTVFIDGVLAYTGSILGGSTISLPTTTVQIASGSAATMSAGSSITVDEVAVYGYVLNASQVANHYALGNATGASYAEFAQETVDARIGHILDTVGWPAADRLIDTSTVTLAATGSVAGKTALSLLQDAAAADLGNVFVDASGRFVFQSRQRYYSTGYTSAATFGDTGFPYQSNVEVGFDDTYIYNDVEITQANSSPAYVAVNNDTTSQGQYGVRSYTATIAAASTNDIDAISATYVNTYRQPHPRVAQVQLDGRSHPANLPQCLGREIGDVVTVVKKSMTGAPTVSVLCMAQGISHDVDQTKWLTTFQLAPVPLARAWVIGDSVYGVLESTAILAF